MNTKGSGIRITTQNFRDIIREMTPTPETGYGGALRQTPSSGHRLLDGRVEVWDLRPGLRINMCDFWLHHDMEIFGDFEQTILIIVLSIDGPWSRIVTDHRGRTLELNVNSRLNLAGIGPPQAFKLRFGGGRFHKSVKVEVTDPLISELTGGNGTETDGALKSCLTPTESRRLLIHRNLSPFLENVTQQLFRCPMSAGAKRLFMEGKALEILAHEIEQISATPHSEATLLDARDLERLHEARNILDAEFVDPPSLFGLARRVGLNDFKLKRGFRKAFGTTVFAYVRMLRMDRARSLLELGDLNVTEAALEAGYSSLGHFAGAFKKRFGILPSECRSGRRKSAER